MNTYDQTADGAAASDVLMEILIFFKKKKPTHWRILGPSSILCGWLKTISLGWKGRIGSKMDRTRVAGLLSGAATSIARPDNVSLWIMSTSNYTYCRQFSLIHNGLFVHSPPAAHARHEGCLSEHSARDQRSSFRNWLYLSPVARLYRRGVQILQDAWHHVRMYPKQDGQMIFKNSTCSPAFLEHSPLARHGPQHSCSL